VLAYDKVLEKCFWGPGKSWKIPGNFLTKTVGTLPWNQSGRKGKVLWRKGFAEEPSLEFRMKY